MRPARSHSGDVMVINITFFYSFGGF